MLVKHVGSAHDEAGLEALQAAAAEYVQNHCAQPDLFAHRSAGDVALSSLKLIRVSHRVARQALYACAHRCGLGSLPPLLIDLALMRIIEPVSKLRSLELLDRYFSARYALRSVYRQLPKLLEHKSAIETAALKTIKLDLKESMSIVLYDVTTLYFESFKEYELQRPGFSKDNKPQQPQIVVGLITTRTGFPVMHEVFEGNTFEGSTMLGMVQRLQERVVGDSKPIVVADAAMLSKANMKALSAMGYRYIVGARLANTTQRLREQIDQQMPRQDGAMIRLQASPKEPQVALICHYSEKRYKKDKREWLKQTQRARDLVARGEPGRRPSSSRKRVRVSAPLPLMRTANASLKSSSVSRVMSRTFQSRSWRTRTW